MEIWQRVDCFDLSKSSYFTYMKKYKEWCHKESDVIRQFVVRIVTIILLF